ncbi:hypothetical protein PM038_17315 [Halorubrum ezzemoulense]|uniref:hypothetical protein n=1 Tax=Halorubrum ezzemoulense TaxID=337243 RepID=UPI00232C3A3D|nr:hypothetical protein [Halorubrum ezzemoulense]MDB2286980.1 hypothetical protein [Halorubrum ezzemoulense]
MATTQSTLNEESESASAESDSEHDSSDYHHSIGVRPTLTEGSDKDRTSVVFVKVDASMAETFETGPERGATAISDLFDDRRDGNITIDQAEQFAWAVTDGMMYAFRADTPSRESTTQVTVTNQPESADALPEPLHTTYQKLTSELPESLDIRIGALPLELFGPSPALGTRLVMEEENLKPARRGSVSGADANALFEDLAGEPFLYYALYRRSSGLPESYEYQVTVRIFLFNPAYKISTESEYADCLRYGRKCDPADSFADLGVSSSLAVIDDGYNVSLYDGSVVPGRETELPDFSSGQARITGETEFTQMRRGQYGASDILEDRCAYTSLLAREIDLEHYVGLGTVDPGGDPWQNAPQATGLDIDAVGVDPEKLLPNEVTIGVTEPIEDGEFDPDRTTANDGTDEHWERIKRVAVAFDNNGYDVEIVTQDTGSRPDIWIRRDDGEIFAVEVEYRTRSKPGSFYTNLIRQAVWGYKTITVMIPQTDDDGRTESLDTLGSWALDKLMAPMKQRDPTKTQLHNCSETITVDGKTMLLPEGVSESRWWLTRDAEYLLVHDGEILARGDATAPFEAFEFNLPRYYKNDGQWVVENKYDKPVQTYDDERDIEHTKVRQCHRPVDLSYVRFVEALYCYDPDTEELVQQEMTAEWDVEQASSRNERSHQQAFETFLVEHETDDAILERDCRPFICDWIGRLSTHDHPGKNIYGKYLKDYHKRERTSTKFGMDPCYPGVSFRYPRGLVSPDLPGLDTTPHFRDRWNIAAEDVLQEPLIHGLADRSDIEGKAKDNQETDS